MIQRSKNRFGALILVVLVAWGATALPGRGAVTTSAELLDADPGGAIAILTPIAASGRASANALFNLGNAWYNTGDTARALVWWRAAGLKNPRNTGVGHNVALARADLDPRTLPVGPHRTWMLLLTPGELMLLALPLFGGFSWSVRQWRRRETHWIVTAALGAGAVALTATALSGWSAAQSAPIAVIGADEAVVRIAPDHREAQQFSLPRGSEVYATHNLGGFTLVQTGDGRKGWVPSGSVLLPRADNPLRALITQPDGG